MLEGCADFLAADLTSLGRLDAPIHQLGLASVAALQRAHDKPQVRILCQRLPAVTAQLPRATARCLPRCGNLGRWTVCSTTGAFGLPASLGSQDATLAVFRLPGPVIGTPPPPQLMQREQFGTAGDDAITLLVSEMEEPVTGGTPFPVLFAAGTTRGAMAGQPHAGGTDIFHARWALTGATTDPFAREWLRQTGTAADESRPGISVTPNDLFIGAGPYLLKASRFSGLAA